MHDISYQMHDIFMLLLVLHVAGVSGSQRRQPAMPVIGVLTYIVCMIVTKLLSLIPGSKYVIG